MRNGTRAANRASSPHVYVHAIETAVPQHCYSQEYALDFMQRLPVYAGRKGFLAKLYRASAIERRYTVIGDYDAPPEERTFYPASDDFTPEPDVVARNALFVSESRKLALEVAQKLFAATPQFGPESITHLITVSCTGFSAPGFDFFLARDLPLAPSVHRLHVGFMGCYAAFPALKTARDICVADPGALVLIVDLELCSLHLQQKLDPEIMVANALFADGAAAALVSSDTPQPDLPSYRLDAFESYIVPDSEDDMAWTVGRTAFDMRLSAYVPKLIQREIRSVIETILARAGVSREDIEQWAIHPGGRAIVEKIGEELGLAPDDVVASYSVLKDYGNMSSATIFFVLKELQRLGRRGPTFAAAFGPGLTVESALLESV